MDTGDCCNTENAPIPISTPKEALDYNMNHAQRGFCLIIENENFSSHLEATKHLTRRHGSEVDVKNLCAVFTMLGFHVVVQKDLKASGIKEILRQVAAADHTNNDCFVCIVLSHGDSAGIFAHDKRYPIDYLFTHFLGDNCSTLVGKPKLFFIQACQGNSLDNGVVVAAPDALDTVSYFKIPTYADFLIAYSTLPGFYSFRNTEKGSWFIRALADTLHEYCMEFDLLTMMTIVCHQVAYKFTSNAALPHLSGKKQVPCITSMLTRRVFLQPKSLRL